MSPELDDEILGLAHYDGSPNPVVLTSLDEFVFQYA